MNKASSLASLDPIDPNAKILLVEDNELNRDMLSRRLERKDFEVVVAVEIGVRDVVLIRKDR